MKLHLSHFRIQGILHLKQLAHMLKWKVFIKTTLYFKIILGVAHNFYYG